MSQYLENIINHIVDKRIDDIYTSFPAVVVSCEKNIAVLKPMIMIDGEELPELEGVPVHQFGGSGYTVEVEILEGTEGMVHFAMRAFFDWLSTGSVDKSENERQFDINDSWFVPGIRSKKTELAPMDNEGIKLRSQDGNHYLWLKNDGNVYCSGDVYSKGEKLTRQSHTHKFTGYDQYKGVTEEAQE